MSEFDIFIPFLSKSGTVPVFLPRPFLPFLLYDDPHAVQVQDLCEQFLLVTVSL